MGIKTYNPYTPSRRQMTGSDFSEITKTAPEKSLVVSLSKNSGRNNQGKITVRHRGGGNRIKYRLVDFKRKKDGIAAKVIGIEYVPEAIVDAKINSALNNIHNTVFYAGDMKDVLNEEFIRRHGHPDVIITDPPRAGMHKDVVDTILKAAPDRIVYVSCNSATQARDLALMDADYEVMAVQAVDMFPHTHHVENIVLLHRR